MSAARMVRERYLAKDRAFCLRMFKERVFRTLQDAQEAMAKEPPAGHVEAEIRDAPALVRSGHWFLTHGCMSAEDLDDLQFYERLTKILEGGTR